MRDQRIKTRNYHALNAIKRSSAGPICVKHKQKEKYVCRDKKQVYEDLEEYEIDDKTGHNYNEQLIEKNGSLIRLTDMGSIFGKAEKEDLE